MKMNLEIEKVLVVSTGCLEQATMDKITRGDVVPPTIPFEYGGLVYTDLGKSAEDRIPTLEPELEAILQLARLQGCAWVKFDRDADVLDGYPRFDW